MHWPGFWAGFLLLLVATPAHAHPARASAVYLDLDNTGVEMELQAPVDQLELALERPLQRQNGALAAQEVTALSAYLAEHIAISSRGNDNFALTVEAVGLARIDDAEHVTAHLALRPGPGASMEQFTLQYDVILHRVVTHKIFVLLRRDVERGMFDDEPKPLGTLRYKRTTLAIDRAGASTWNAFRALFLLGMRHIAEGSDHILFLLLLLLPAPMLARSRRWSEPRSLRGTAMQILTVVTAFTLGHSITLTAGTIGVLHLPSRPVEVLIAASIFVSAVHAAIPVFPRREWLVGASFGLVHGLAFSTILAELGLRGPGLVLSLLAFNLGIEVMQLLVVALTVPWLILLSCGPLSGLVRIAGGILGGAVALAWMAERAWGMPNPLGRLVDRAFAYPVLILSALAGAAIAAAAIRPVWRRLGMARLRQGAE